MRYEGSSTLTVRTPTQFWWSYGWARPRVRTLRVVCQRPHANPLREVKPRSGKYHRLYNLKYYTIHNEIIIQMKKLLPQNGQLRVGLEKYTTKYNYTSISLYKYLLSSLSQYSQKNKFFSSDKRARQTGLQTILKPPDSTRFVSTY